MDIQRWLDETVQPEAPPGTSKRKAPRKRSRSDSSILDPRPPSPFPQQANSDGGTSEALHATLSNYSTASRYARKPRRKTRPEHYEPGSHAPQKQKDKSRKTKRRKSKALPGTVQNFQAKNVSGDRLTLKPRELGLFNKGRTSMAVKGRGLPDLVFSEMKFLQKEKAQAEVGHWPEVAKNKRKKDHVQAKEGEISGFFTSTHPKPTEQDVNILPEHASVLENKRHTCNQHSVTNTTIPTVELPDKAPYLGFGSKDPRHGSTSYVSWSESDHAPSTTPARFPLEADISYDQRDLGHRGRYKPKISSEDDRFKRPTPPARKQENDHITERFRVSSLVPSHNRTSRSHSHPQRSSSPRRLNLVDRSARFESTDTACSPSSMPPSMPPRASVDLRPTQPGRSPRDGQPEATANCDERPLAERQNYSHNSDYENTDGELQTSSDLGRVLQQCNEILHERRQAVTPRRRHPEEMDTPYASHSARREAVTPYRRHPEEMDTSYPSHSARRHHMRGAYSSTRRVPTVRFVDPPYQEPVLPNFIGYSIYEQQAQRRRPPRRSHMDEDMYQSSYPMEYGCPDENERILDEHNWEGSFEEPILYELEGSLGILGEEDCTTAIETGHTPNLRSESDVVAPGFWRPNKLY